MPARRRFGLVLTLACLLLAAIAAMPWLGVAGGPVPPPADDAAADAGAGPRVDLGALALLGLDAFPQTRERPLFLSTRRAIAAASDGAAAVGGLMDRYVVTGVVIAPNRRLVLLRPAGGGGVLRIAEGDVLDGWLIEEIANDFLTVVADGRREVVPLVGRDPATRR